MPGRKFVDPRDGQPNRNPEIAPNPQPDEAWRGETSDEVVHRRPDEDDEDPPRRAEDDRPRTAVNDELRGEDEEADEDEIVSEMAFDNDPIAPVEEPGLSVEPEDLGAQWLVAATEQGNFESSMADIEEAGIQIITVPIKGPV